MNLSGALRPCFAWAAALPSWESYRLMGQFPVVDPCGDSMGVAVSPAGVGRAGATELRVTSATERMETVATDPCRCV